MTILETILNFKQALTAVIPAFDKAGLPWRRPDAYDEWDGVAMALFASLVVEVLRWQLPEGMREGFRLAPYDQLLSSYRGFSTIEIGNLQGPKGERHVFHALGTNQDPFDSIEFRRVSVDGEPLDEKLDVIPLRNVSLLLRVVGSSTQEVLILE